METPKKKDKAKMPPAPETDNGPQVSLTRKILVGIFILGFWVFFYWFR
jgi:hypothetical protein